MEPSLFINWVSKFFPGITVRVVETLNGQDRLPSYLHRTMLRKEESVDGKWESVTADNVTVAADVVAMDSSLPLKSRPAISSASGDIPKMGMELKLNENQLTALDTLVAKKATDAQIIAKLFADTPRCITGIYEQNEAIFLQGLSTGIALVESNNVGTGIRLDYGFKAANKSGVAKLWSDVTATTLSDIAAKIELAASNGHVINKIMLDRATFNKLKASNEGKDLYAAAIGNFGSTKPVPTQGQFLAAFSDEYGAAIQIVERSVNYEKNGVKTAVKPWAAGAVVFLTSDEVGSLVWAKLAEANPAHQSKAVNYSIVDDFILVSKYALNRPSLAEYTSSQARVVPVIANVDQIYLLDTATVQA